VLTKRLSDLTAADIDALIGVSESRYLDFKSAPVGGQDKDKREFLADVSAFANASGGDIIFGVDEQEGVASAVPGIRLEDVEKEKLRLESLIRSGIEPRITHFDLDWLQATAGAGMGYLIVRVPRSWAAPHRVTLQGHDKFYIRNSAGKHPMNVDELRQAFTLSQTITERMRGFRSERIQAILNDGAPFGLKPGAKLVFHGVPFSTFVDPPALRLEYSSAPRFPPFGSTGFDYQHTLEGLATHTPRQADGVRAYTLLFRNGIVEGVAEIPSQQAEGGQRQIFLGRIEQYVMAGWAALLQLSEEHGIDPPYYIFISVLNIRGVVPFIPEAWAFEVTGNCYRRDHLLLPELEIAAERVGQPNTALFKGAFDQLANAFGLHGSLSYDRAGQFLGPRR
jgi:hypothetical protein